MFIKMSRELVDTVKALEAEQQKLQQQAKDVAKEMAETILRHHPELKNVPWQADMTYAEFGDGYIRLPDGCGDPDCDACGDELPDDTGVKEAMKRAN